MLLPPPPRSRAVRIADAIFIALGVGLLLLVTIRYQMPFRLDDVLHIEWAREHSLFDAFTTEIVRSLRPLFAMTVWILANTAGTDSYFAWHVTLAATFLIGLAFTGLTARYIAQRASALYFTVSIFWIAFLPILNVLFWFADLTFTLELMFVAAAWYYGLRALCEARLGFWITACFLAICAVLSKEPAIVLINVVYVGTLIFYINEIKAAWKQRNRSTRSIAILSYLIFLAICIWLYLASPTKTNRFFDLQTVSSESLKFFIGDRLRYYGEFLTSSYTRLILLIPLLSLLIESLKHRLEGKKPLVLYTSIFVFIGVTVLASTQPLFILSFYIAIPILAYFIGSRYKSRLLMLLPFTVCMAIVFATLLITIMLVKTQMVEFAFLAALVSGSCWSFWADSIGSMYRRDDIDRSEKRLAVFSLAGVAVIAGAIFIAPIISAKESLLLEVQATRFNANNAVKWMARQLPTQSTVLVTGPKLYGIANESDLTGLDDETKAFAQYTFLQGYIRTYFELLDRPDLTVSYLEDSTTLHNSLDSARMKSNTYLFLQTGRDAQRFHSTIDGAIPLKASDSLLISFKKGRYPSEVWKIGAH